jgi:hypothetical protein
VTPPSAPISFTATARDLCGSSKAVVTGYQCSFLNPSGRPVDKTGSCVVRISDATLTILDSGGVGTQISWNVVATDDHGNKETSTCSVGVTNPGRGPKQR